MTATRTAPLPPATRLAYDDSTRLTDLRGDARRCEQRLPRARRSPAARRRPRAVTVSASAVRLAGALELHLD